MNFLYCFDKNYNIQASISIHSLLEHLETKVNIHIIHKNPHSFNKLLKKIKKHKNLSNIFIHKFNKSLDFPKLEEAHVSEATYYRIFISDYIDEHIEDLIYLDADTVIVNNPESDLISISQELNSSNKTIAAKTEKSLSEHSKKLTGNENYFNAGVMFINYKKWLANNSMQGLLLKMNEIQNKIIFWDQDVLNAYFNGEYLEINDSYNYKVDVDDPKQGKIDIKNIKILHYVGKSKPWTVRGASKDNSIYYQNKYDELFFLPYHISNNWKRQAFDDLRTLYKFNLIKRVKKPVGFTISVIYFLLKYRDK
jgi:lipopolysaccharide biosynthesis glycosyltransferase